MIPDVSGNNNRIAEGDYYEFHKPVIIEQGVRACPSCSTNIMNVGDEMCTHCAAKQRFSKFFGNIVLVVMIVSLGYFLLNDFIMSLGFVGNAAAILTWCTIAIIGIMCVCIWLILAND